MALSQRNSFASLVKEVENLYPELWPGVTTGYPVRFRDTKKPGKKTSTHEFLLPEEIKVAEARTLYEGAVRSISVNAYERNPKARQKCIAHYGTRCYICGLSFAEGYGKVGNGLIQVHHLQQLSNIGKKYKVDPINDLRPVCPNCHAIIHRRKPAYSIDEVKAFLQQASAVN